MYYLCVFTVYLCTFCKWTETGNVFHGLVLSKQIFFALFDAR